jgi:hypothetical protein
MRTLATVFALGFIACIAVQVFVVLLGVAALRRIFA